MEDVSGLVDAFTQSGCYSFATFKSLWSARHFSLMHQCSAAASVQRLYSAALSFIDSAREEEQVAGLYTVYTLYRTQPQRTQTGAPHKSLRIGVTPQQLETLIALNRKFSQHADPRFTDVQAVLAWLHEHQPFLFTAEHPCAMPEPSTKTSAVMQSSSVLSEAESNFDSLDGVLDRRLDGLVSLYREVRESAGLSPATSVSWNLDELHHCVEQRSLPAITTEDRDEGQVGEAQGAVTMSITQQ